MTVTAAVVLSLFCQGQDENPLLPRYPFKSAKITYKRGSVKSERETLAVEAVAHIRGGAAHFKTRLFEGDKLREESVRFTDGTHIYYVELERGPGGTKKTAKRKPHYGAYLRAECAEMLPGERRKFDAAREAFWNLYSPVFGLDFEDGKLKPKLEAGESICGRACEVFTLDLGPIKVKYWRLKGTDIILKFEGGGGLLEADKIEENVEVPEGLFERPDGASEDVLGGQFEKDRAAKIFKEIAGRDAERVDREAMAAKVKGLAFDGKDVPLSKFRFEWAPAESDLDGTIRIVAEQSPWGFELQASVKADKVEKLVGKTLTLDGENAYASLSDGNVAYGSRNGKLTVVSANDRAIVIRISGPWVKKKVDEDGDGNTAGNLEVEIRAVAR